MNLKNGSLIVCIIFALVSVIAVIPIANAFGIATPPSPVVDFTGAPQSGAVPLVVTFTDHSIGTGGILTYAWDFGDGNVTNATVQNPVHTYTNVGTYNVSLTVNNGVRNTTTVKTGYIIVTATPIPPIADFIGSPRSGAVNLTVMFTDNSTGTDPLTFSWDFGDGSAENATVQNPVHTFVNIGTYNVSLNATNSVGSNTTIKTGFITVSDVPVANFTATPLNGTAPLTVVFTDLSTNIPTAWNWSFTDVTGNNTQVWFSTAQNPVHTFGVGNYSVVLNASNSAGYNLSTQVTFINVSDIQLPNSSKIGVVRDNSTWILDASGNGAFGAGDLTYAFGKAGDVYVTGDWTGNGTTMIGVVRDNSTWILDASGNGTFGAGDLMYTFGKAGDVYVTGDWTGNGTTMIGVVRDNSTWILDASGNGAFGAGDLVYTFGKAGDVYVTGDWTGNGTTMIGVVRDNSTWILDASGNGAFGAGDLVYTFGKDGDVFVTGDWNADNKTEIGVVRNGNTWLLDASGNGAYGINDFAYVFGIGGDKYVTGKWI